MIVGTAGHIDHGKTSLVKAITGIDADRLKEEKERGITIDLGFAYWPQENGETIGFVDVPGHERFVHTMLAGAQGIDLVMLVVAADDGVMPQTREHLEIIELLGLGRAIVALTKVDRVSPSRIVEARNEIAALLAPTRLNGSPVFPVSSNTGHGVAELSSSLRDMAKVTGRRSENREFRLAVDRSFVLQGAGVVVTGMALDGSVKVGEEVIVSPSGILARVRSIHAQNNPTQTGKAGDRCALNLAGPGIFRDVVGRGEMVTTAASHAPTQRIDAALALSRTPGQALRQWMPARLHHGTAEVGARVVLLDDGTPDPDGAVRIQLVLEKPLAARALDRFILRDVTASRTIGGGRFIDLRAPDRKRRTPQRRAIFDALTRDAPRDAMAAWLEGPALFLDIDLFARDRGLTRTQIEDLTSGLNAVIFGVGGARFAFASEKLNVLKSSVLSTLENFHAFNPDRPGLGLEALRFQIAPIIPAALFREALRMLASGGIVSIDGGWVRLSAHRIELSSEDERLQTIIAPMLDGAARFRPPRVRDIGKITGVDEERVRNLFRRLSRRGEIDEIAADHFFLRPVVAEMVRAAQQTQGRPGNWFTAAAFRDALEADGQIVGRKVAIQILEFLDRQGVTIRRGDQRRVNPLRSDLFESAQDETGRGRESLPVERPDFKSGWGRETVPGGFDSHSLPPAPREEPDHANGY